MISPPPAIALVGSPHLKFKAWLGSAGPGKSRRGMAWLGVAGVVRQGRARLGAAWLGVAVAARFGGARRVRARPGKARRGMAVLVRHEFVSPSPSSRCT